MSIARAALLRASRSQFLADQFRSRAFGRRAVRRFMPGEDMTAALAAADEFSAEGIGTVLTNLGEQISTREEADAVRQHYMSLLDAVRERGLPTEISVKLTHLGLAVDVGACMENVRALVAAAGAAGSTVWLDMEESTYVDATLALYRQLRSDHQRVGLCLQAYLHRTPADVESLLPLAPSIRLVKGAYREPADIAHARKGDTDVAFVTLAKRLLDHSPAGAFTVLGTHDARIIEDVREYAERQKLPARAYEVHMLYGIRAAMQRDLARSGTSVRVLISYGEHWFPWYMRRIAERPANLWFVVRNLMA
ncbi:MAG: proline dehydrogenase family protein [Gemmatimonadetes bacterium]|nr:proline dehydrogenase family protein [Gemmatimonadota bacterium]